MRLKLLLFLSAFFFSANCYPCSPGYFTKAYPCDRRAILLHRAEDLYRTIRNGKWRFYYLPLLGIEGNLGLNARISSNRPLDAYVSIRSADENKLPNDIDFHYAFQLQNGNSNSIPFETLTKGMKNRNEARMLLAVRNPYASNVNVGIRYFTSPIEEEKDPKRNKGLKGLKSSSSNQLILGVVIGIIATALTALLIGFIVHRTIQKRRNAIRIDIRIESDAQGIVYAPPQPNQNNIRPSEALTWEELQKYFPKKAFKTIENPFQQTGCSVCLEEFQPKTGCHQLHCNHIFHGECIRQWLQKQNSCPGCRVPLERKVIEDFLEKQKRQNEDNSFNAIHLKIENEEVTTK